MPDNAGRPSFDDDGDGIASLLGHPGLQHDEAMVALAAALSDAAPARLWDRLDDAARPLFGLHRSGLAEQAGALGEVVTNQLGLEVATDGYERLLLHEALAARRAHPTLLAALGHELARRAGLRSAVACTSSDHWTILIGDDAFLPIGYGAPGEALGSRRLRACCAHQVAHQMLVAVAASAPEEITRRADRLRTALVFACRISTSDCREPPS